MVTKTMGNVLPGQANAGSGTIKDVIIAVQFPIIPELPIS
jgi:hypothetical protein